MLLFDIAGCERVAPNKTFTEGDGWTVLAEMSVAADVLTRRIVTFRQDGTHYRRDSETHQLSLFDPDEIESDLQGIGFQVRRINGYGDVTFPPGLHGFLACKADA